MDYHRVSIYTATAGVEPVGALLLELDCGGYEVRDSADFEDFLAGKSGHWDYIDDELLKLRDAETVLRVYLAKDARGARQLGQLEDGLARLRALDTEGAWGRLALRLEDVREEDWAESWKQYYKPVKIGRLVIRPSWEAYAPAPGETVLAMDPGMAFGTGTHDSTRLCLQLLEEYARPGAQVLDVGCGSGILAVAALLLGAQSAIGFDTDETAVRVARENARCNGVQAQARFHCGVAQAPGRRFDIICMNIVADVIIGYLPQIPDLLAPGGVLIASGIIDTREADVLAAIGQCGLGVLRRKASGGWVALAAG